MRRFQSGAQAQARSGAPVARMAAAWPTADLGGSLSTREMADEVIRWVAAG